MVTSSDSIDPEGATPHEWTAGSAVGQDWCDLAWTPWISFSENNFSTLPAGPGMYRVRVTGLPSLAYIGETGVSVRRRLGALRLNVGRGEMPFNENGKTDYRALAADPRLQHSEPLAKR